MADEMKELRGAVFDLIPDGVSVVALDEIEVDDMAPKRGTSRTRTATSSTALTTSASVVSSTNSRRGCPRLPPQAHPRQGECLRPAASLRRDPGNDPAPTHWPRAALPYAVDDLGFTIVADGVESASAGTNTGRHSNE